MACMYGKAFVAYDVAVCGLAWESASHDPYSSLPISQSATPWPEAADWVTQAAALAGVSEP